MENFEKLKAVRKGLRLNQEEMAKRLAITQSYYSALETGRRGLTYTIINDLIEDLNVSPTWFYHDKGDIFITNSNKELKNVSENLSQNVTSYAKNAQDSTVEIRDLLPSLLNDIIKEKLFYMDFYLTAISYHLYTTPEEETTESKQLKEVEKFLKSLINKYSIDFEIDKKPDYREFDVLQKVQLIKEFEDYIRTILDRIWLVTRDIKELKLNSAKLK